jgi:hypothetical protein
MFLISEIIIGSWTFVSNLRRFGKEYNRVTFGFVGYGGREVAIAVLCFQL